MKKKGLILGLAIIMLFICCGCAKQGGDPVSATGCSRMFNGVIAEASDGVYGFLGPDQNYLYYWDFTLNDAVKVCGKPECSHSEKACNAYFRYPVADLTTYMNGLLYVWDYEPDVPTGTLYCMDPDGSNRRRICSFSPEDGRKGVPNFGVYSETDCYVITTHGVNDYSYIQWGVYRVSLTEEDQQAKLIYFPEATDDIPERSVEPIGIDGDCFYFMVSKHGKNVTETEFYCYDPADESLEMIYSTDYASVVLATFYDNKMYFVEKPNYEDFIGACLYVMDLDTGEKQLLAEDGGVLTCDDSYLYLINGDISVYDFQGNFVCKVTPDFKEDVSEYYGYTGMNCVYFMGTAKENGAYIYQLIEKGDLGKSTCKIRQLSFQ